MKSEVLRIVQEIHADEAYLKYIKDRWGIDFKGGKFEKKAIDAGIDCTHFFSDPDSWVEGKILEILKDNAEDEANAKLH